MHGLDEVVVAAELQGLDRGADGRVARHHDDGDGGVPLPDHPDELEPVGVGEVHVQQRHVEDPALEARPARRRRWPLRPRGSPTRRAAPRSIPAGRCRRRRRGRRAPPAGRRGRACAARLAWRHPGRSPGDRVLRRRSSPDPSGVGPRMPQGGRPPARSLGAARGLTGPGRLRPAASGGPQAGVGGQRVGPAVVRGEVVPAGERGLVARLAAEADAEPTLARSAHGTRRRPPPRGGRGPSSAPRSRRATPS